MFQFPFFTTLILLSLTPQLRIQAFNIISATSNTHQNITLTAILQKSAEVCQVVVLKQGRFFVQPKVLTAESVAQACLSPASASSLKEAISDIKNRNAWTDLIHFKDPEYHFDNEEFAAGRGVITQGLSVVKASLKLKNYESAREQLGEILHTLQDFYSHSNWIELDNRIPYPNLINPYLLLDSLADNKTATCSSCTVNCTNNILDTVIKQRKLTSGYYIPPKPAGKCSHGGTLDVTSLLDPTGGINKDDQQSPHGSLHLQAADVATAATRDLLEDIRRTTTDTEFLRLMGITSSSSVLCIVIDTSASMAKDIDEIKRITNFIIDSRQGTADQPSTYILVPFNSTVYGNVTKMTDPDKFKSEVKKLSAGGEGSLLRYSLSALWLALAAAPSGSEIFLFTDAGPALTDILLKSTIEAMIESTKSTVNFILTNPLTNLTSIVPNPVNLLYQQIAEASGGHFIEVSKERLPNATSLITNSTISGLVNIFYVVKGSGGAGQYTILVDPTVTNLTFYITGSLTVFAITSPSGQIQASLQSEGSLGIIETVANLQTVRINSPNPAGNWTLNIASLLSCTIKVTGKSPINFKFDLVDIANIPLPNSGYSVSQTRPSTDGSFTLLVSLLGSGSGLISELVLVDSSGSGLYKGSLEDQGSGDYLVTVETAPKGDFYIRITGQFNSSTSSKFQRQSSTRYRASTISITVLRNTTLSAGQIFTVGFVLKTSTNTKSFLTYAKNTGQDFMLFSPILPAVNGYSAGVVVFNVSANATAGTEHVLTIAVTDQELTTTNYVFLRLAVSAAVAPPAGLELSLWLSGLTLLISSFTLS
uniref:Uncharacterized protein n=1 Tax=Astyanax mexicanus TaxID=7994 RepID=A0A3B1JGI1_ASTMX